MEILSDTVFRGGMQAKSVTVENVNITSDSVVVPSLYANALLLCGGSKSITDFSDITKYVDVGSGGSGSGGIFVCGSKSSFLTQTFEDVIVGNKRSNSDDNYPLMFRGFNTSGSTDCSYNIYSHCGFRTSWGIQLGFTENDDGTGGGYIDLNGQRIKKWEDICVYLNNYSTGCSICGGCSISGGSGLKLYNCLFSDWEFDIPEGCQLFVFHTIKNVSPENIGPIEIRVCAAINEGTGIVYSIDKLFGNDSYYYIIKNDNGSDIVICRNTTDYRSIVTPRVVTTIQQ